MNNRLVSILLIATGVILSGVGSMILPADKLILFLPVTSGLIASGTTFLQRDQD